MKAFISTIFLLMSANAWATRVEVVVKDMNLQKQAVIGAATLVSPSLVVTAARNITNLTTYTKSTGSRVLVIKLDTGDEYDVESWTYHSKLGLGWLHLGQIASGCSEVDGNATNNRNYEGNFVTLRDGPAAVQIHSGNTLLLDKRADYEREGEGVYFNDKLIGVVTSGKMNIMKVKLVSALRPVYQAYD